MSTASSATDTRGRDTITLVAVCLAVLVLPASLTGTAVALPQIAVELDAGLAPLQWVVNSYNLAFACFMLACGSLADLIGRRRMFAAGTILFGLSALVSAVTSNIYVLDGARAAAGLGAAAVMTAGAAIFASTFEGAALTRAFALLGSAAGAGLALGPSTAGLLVGTFGWRAVFVSHLVVAALVLTALPLIRESRNPAATRVDWAGTATFTLSLLCLMLGIVLGPQQGWADVGTIAFFGAAALLMVLFLLAESRGEQPMFDLALFKQARFMAVSLVPVALSFGFVCLLVLLPGFFTGVVGMTTNEAGTTMMLLTLPVLVIPLLVSKLVARGLPNRVVLSASLLLAAIGAVWLTVADADAWIGSLVGPLLLIGTAMGMTAGLVDGVAVTSVEPEKAGAAAGMFNTMRLAGEAVAIAVMGAVLLSVTAGGISDGLTRIAGKAEAQAGPIANQVIGGDLAGAADGLTGENRTAFVDVLTGSYTTGMHSVLWTAAVICALSAAVVYLMLRSRKTPAAASEEQVRVEAQRVDA